MRIVLDTNIWISAVISENGRMKQLIDKISRNNENVIIVSSSILDEITKTLNNNNRNRKNRKKRKTFTEVHRVRFNKLLQIARVEFIESKQIESLDIYISDPNDRHVIETAINGNADVIITGDSDFADVKTNLFKVIRPSEF